MHVCGVLRIMFAGWLRKPLARRFPSAVARADGFATGRASEIARSARSLSSRLSRQLVGTDGDLSTQSCRG